MKKRTISGSAIGGMGANRMPGPKIVHFTTGHTPYDIRIFGRECKALAREGYDLTLIAPFDAGQIPDVVEGVTFRNIPIPQSRLARVTVTVWRALREAIRQQADIYHFHDPELLFAGLALRLSGKVVVYDVHEDVPQTLLYSPWLPKILRRPVSWIFERFERFVSRLFSALVTANDEIHSRVSRYNRNVTSLHNYPLTEMLPYSDYTSDSTPACASMSMCGTTSAQTNQQPMIASFGGVSEQTCTAPIVEAMSLIPMELHANLILGGSTASEELLHRLAGLSGWQRTIHRGRLPRNEMTRELHRAAVAVVLYSPEPNHYGIGSNRFFEAMAAGIPVITSNFPNWKAILERIQCGLAVAPEQPKEIAEAITYLLTHPSEARQMGLRGQAAVRNEFNWDKEKGKLLDLYGGLAQRVASTNARSAARRQVLDGRRPKRAPESQTE